MRGDGTLWLPKGSKVWWGRYYRDGKAQTFNTKERSETKARQALRLRVAGALTDSAPPEDVRRLTYGDLEAGLHADYRANGRDLANLPHKLAPLRLTFGAYRAVQITTAAMRVYVAARLEQKAAPATVNNELALLRRMLRLARADGLHVPPVPMLRVNNARTGFVDPGDFEALVVALPVYLRPLVRFAYLTGWRKGEILGLTWDRIDLRGGTIRLDAHHTKTDTGRVFAFAPNSPLTALLAERAKARRLDCPHVFHRNGRRIRDFYGAWDSAVAAIGRPDLVFHDLRRSAVRDMVRAGVPERICMARSGHKTRSMFDRYNIVSEGDLRDADAKVAAYLRASGEPSKNRQTERQVVAITEKRQEATR